MSTDSPKQTKAGMKAHGLQATMLADPQLEVICNLGIANQAFPKINSLIAKMLPGNIKLLPIPTTVLADATGVVRWIDQSENYQQRSDPNSVLAALQAHL